MTPYENAIILAFFGLVCVGFVLNLLNILVIIFVCPTPKNFYLKLLISLSVSDILTNTAALTILLDVGLHALGVTLAYHVSDRLWILFIVLNLIPLITAPLNYTVIALDIFLLIVKPLKHAIWTGNKVSKCVIAIIWGPALAFAVSVGILAWYDRLPRAGYVIGVIVLTVSIICLITLVIVYTWINIHMCKIRKQQIGSSPAPSYTHNKKLLITSLLLLGTFLVGWLPFVINYFHTGMGFWNTDSVWVLYFVIIAFLINSICDPLIYAIRLDQIRAAYKQVWTKIHRCCGCCAGDPDREQRRTEQ